MSKKTTRYHKIGRWIISTLDTLFTWPDVVFFIWYGLMRNGVKEKRKAEIKRSKRIRTKSIDFTTLFNVANKQLTAHLEDVPFIVRLIPTVVVSALIWVTIILVV